MNPLSGHRRVLGTLTPPPGRMPRGRERISTTQRLLHRVTISREMRAKRSDRPSDSGRDEPKCAGCGSPWLRFGPLSCWSAGPAVRRIFSKGSEGSSPLRPLTPKERRVRDGDDDPRDSRRDTNRSTVGGQARGTRRDLGGCGACASCVGVWWFGFVGGACRRGDEHAAVWTSVDGITWSRVPHDEGVFGGDDGEDDQRMNSVIAGGRWGGQRWRGGVDFR